MDFGRYPVDVLVEQYDTRDDQEKPYGIVVFPEDDHNGSFYDEAIDPGNLYNSSLFLPVQGRILVPLENINPFISDLDSLKEKVGKMEVNNHTTAVLQLIELRKKSENQRIKVTA